MNKKNTIKKTAALLLGVSFALCGAGCNFFPTPNELDLKQEIATIDISDYVDTAEDGKYAAYAAAIEKVIDDCGLNTSIKKRELVAYFLNQGSSYINEGHSYRETFNLMLDTLVTRKLMVQYALVYFLAQKDDSNNAIYTAADCETFVNAGLNDTNLTEKEKSLLSANREILTMKYFLTKNGTDMERFDKAVYNLKYSVNSSLDSIERSYITAETGDDATPAERATPKGVGTQKEDYYTTDYDVYTGRNLLEVCGKYERLDGSSQATRLKAYNKFLSNLDSNHLLTRGEDTSKFTELNYYYVELSSMLEQAIITMFSDALTDESYETLTETYVQGRYNEIVENQETSYTGEGGVSNFETAIGSVSDESFVLYSPTSGYGFVYNILLPFSAWQKQALSAENNRHLTQKELYAKRELLLRNVEAEDLRGDWFSHNDDYNYSYAASTQDYYKNAVTTANTTNYLFFEDNFTQTDKYEGLGQYLGKYPYNGTVEMKDEKYVCTPDSLTIDEFIGEMQAYVGYALQDDSKVTGALYANYVQDGNYTETTDPVTKQKTYKYDEFMYYTGKVDVGTPSVADYFKPETDAYKAVSAINELMFAYSTDTGCLNTYMGYTVSPFTTSYVKEFEYAAQYAVRQSVTQGPGNYVVCATEFGWHIIYVSFVYANAGDVYGGYDADEALIEGTFSNLFYEFLKSEVTKDQINELQNVALQEYNTNSVVRYEDRYEDLLSLGE